MTAKELIKQLEDFPEDMEVKVLYVAPNKMGYYAEPRLLNSNGKVLILQGNLELITYAQH